MSRFRQTAFDTTRWSVVLTAGELPEPAAREALAELFRVYWYPLYAFARRRGHDSEASSDLVQGFFTRLLETNGLRGAERERGRFRSYLLGAFKHYLANERDQAEALKRGGGERPLSLDMSSAEDRYIEEPADELTPERIYERRWALTVLDRAVARLRQEWTEAGKEAAFLELKDFLTGIPERGTHRSTAEELGMSEGAVRVAVHRLRRRFASLLQAEIAATVSNPGDVRTEMQFLFEALRR